MAFTAEQLAAMEQAAAQGLTHVQSGDKILKYQTLPDLIAAIKLARADVAAASGVAPPPPRRYMEYGRG